MKRMFRWKGILICATSLEAAWAVLEATAAFHGSGDFDGDMAQWEREYTRTFVDEPGYDEVVPREYLHAINPEEYLELLDQDVPDGLVSVSDMVYAESAGVTVNMEARSWASLLPAGWAFVPDPFEHPAVKAELDRRRQLYVDAGLAMEQARNEIRLGLGGGIGPLTRTHLLLIEQAKQTLTKALAVLVVEAEAALDAALED